MAKRPTNEKTVVILLDLLRLIPSKMALDSSALLEQLKGMGHNVELRSIQRHLKTLTEVFPIDANITSKPYSYRWKEDVPYIRLSSLSAHESLLLMMAEKNLKNLLPVSLSDAMASFFDHARRNLNNPLKPDAKLSLARDWLGKVTVMSPVLQLVPAEVKPGVFEALSNALYNNFWLDIVYVNGKQETKDHRVRPIGIGQQGAKTYVVVMYENSDKPINLALHRFQSAIATDLPFTPPDNFNFEKYDSTGGLAFGTGQIKLKIKAVQQVARLLTETRLATDQVVTWGDDAQSFATVEATVTDSLLLHDWIRSKGASVQVLAPADLVQKIQDSLAPL